MMRTCSAVLLLAALAQAQEPRRTDPPPTRHLLLVVEGDVMHLGVTHAIRKAGACQVRKSPPRTFEAVALGITGKELGRYPLDLSAFDTNPANVGKPPRVQGCRVISTRVVTLLQVPDHPNLARIELRRGKKVLGVLGVEDLAALLGRRGK